MTILLISEIFGIPSTEPKGRNVRRRKPARKGSAGGKKTATERPKNADAELDGVTFHTLGHTCASHLVMAGVDLVTVKEILRHKDIQVTMLYSHLSPEHKKSAVDALETALLPMAENVANRFSYQHPTHKRTKDRKC